MTTRTKRCAMSSQVEALIGSDRGLLKDLVKEALHEQTHVAIRLLPRAVEPRRIEEKKR